MVLAVCVLLGGALFFYLLGVITMRIEPMLTATDAHEQAPQILPAPDARPQTPPARERDAAPQGVQRSPRTDILPAEPEQSTPRTAARQGRPMMERADDAPPLTRVPPPEPEPPEAQPDTASADVTTEPLGAAAPRAAREAPGPRTVALPSATDSEEPSTDLAKPETEEAPASPSTEAVSEPPQPDEQPTPPTEDEGEPALDKIDLPPDTVSPQSEDKPFYSIQLIAFSRSNREKAEAYAKEVRESAGLDVELETSSDGELVRVFVGRYADREAALRACRELQKQPQFSSVFVPQTSRGTRN